MATAKDRISNLPFNIENVYDDISLTFTPQVFYEFLLKEIGLSKRRGSEISILVLDLSESTAEVSVLLKDLMEIAIIIKQNLRSDEIFSRLGLESFAILIHGNEDVAMKASNRIALEIKNRLKINEVETVINWRWQKYEPSMTLLDWLGLVGI